ncbi:TetR/AcrR family transcriptional regulator [bacterium]|nr:TetR/AcrR family transcriptional regulator [bacterium]
MKVKQGNQASLRTRAAIREEFARLLNKYRQIDKISVTQLAHGAGISRSTFYTHYTGVDEVAADIKNETLRVFFEHKKIRDQADAEKIVNSIYRYLKKNDRIFRLMLKAPGAESFALELGSQARAQLLENIKLARLQDTHLLDLELSMIADGLSLLCVRYYREELDASLEDIFACVHLILENLMTRRQREQVPMMSKLTSKLAKSGV